MDNDMDTLQRPLKDGEGLMIDKTFYPAVPDVNCSQPAPGRHPVRLIKPGSWNHADLQGLSSPADSTLNSQFYGNLQFRQMRKETGERRRRRRLGKLSL